MMGKHHDFLYRFVVFVSHTNDVIRDFRVFSFFSSKMYLRSSGNSVKTMHVNTGKSGSVHARPVVGDVSDLLLGPW